MNNPKPHKRNTYKDSRFLGSQLKEYEKLYGKPLTEAKAEELRSNLTKYLELLIELDEQQRQLLAMNDTLRKYNVTN